MRLKDLEGPHQLKGLTVAQLQELAAEIRQVILETVARNGGHLAPNLGTVELTLALHTVFDSPRDKILWDVSHQSYPHKLVTGRLDRFHTLRQFGGLAGYTDPRESPHDHFHWGHASTSISAAVGMAKARDLLGEDYEVVAVIGDGALTGGMAYEALDHGGHEKTRVIVVLNDNSMSISPNVGAISQFLARIRTGPGYQAVKQQAAEFLRHLPLVGPQAFEMVDRWKESIKQLFLPTMFFENLGWTYIGPVDGHNIPALIEAFQQARRLKEPVVVHVVTTKGKGVPYAEQLPEKFHGGGPFDVATGKTQAGGPPTYSEVFGNTLVKLAQANPRVVAITAAMCSGCGLTRFAKQFPDRFFDVGIAEQHAATFAAGLARAGMRPVFAVYSTFLQRAYDQVIHDICLQNLPVVLAIDRGGLVEDGATHQGVFDIAYLRTVPNIVIGAPKDENELQHMLYTGLCHDGPFAFRYPRGKAQGVPLDPEPRLLPIGKAEVLREGSDLAILALGVWAPVALQAARILAEEGIEAAVVNPRWVKPLDGALIEALARETGLLLTVEEGSLAGGFGAAVLEYLADRGITGVRVDRMGVPDRFMDHGNPKHHYEALGLTPAGIADRARQLVLAARAELPNLAQRRVPVQRVGRRLRLAAGSRDK